MPACRRRPSLLAAAAAVALAALAALAAPTAALAATAAASPRRALASTPRECLCLFDVDRTLTSMQGAKSSTCPGDQVFSTVPDPAYLPSGASPGPFTASEFALNIRNSFCGQKCHLGVISAGKMSGGGGAVDPEHGLITGLLSKSNGNAKMPAASKLSWAKFGSSTLAPFIWGTPATSKYQAVPTIQKYYAQFGAKIDDDQVFFFDDIAENVKPWGSTRYHAHQIACDKRAADPTGKHHAGDPSKYLGLCGATVNEVNGHAFKKTCSLCNGAC
jgi:hypothetical protein